MRFLLGVMAFLCAALPAAARPPEGGNPFGQNVMNPDISVIGEVGFANVSVKDEAAATSRFPSTPYTGMSPEGKSRGFNFNYLELTIKAPVDPYFDLFGVVTFSDGGVEVEEAYVDTRQLPGGFALRVGKLLSAFGRFNAMHRHYWDFYEPPIAYELMFGPEGFGDVGGRVTWTAPLDFLLQLHVEVFQGVFDSHPTFNARSLEVTREDDGATMRVDQSPVPAVIAGSVKTSFDAGDHVFLAGASLMHGPTSIQGPNWALFGDETYLWGAEFTYKYLISSYRSLTLQSEFLRRTMHGTAILPVRYAPPRKSSYAHSAVYAQVIWRFDGAGRWKTGARYDQILEADREGVSKYKRPRYSGMLEFSPTEFSRVRIQYNRDRTRYHSGKVLDLDEILLQLTFSVGPHGAHTF